MPYRFVAASLSLFFATLIVTSDATAQYRPNSRQPGTDSSPYSDDIGNPGSGRISGTVRTFDGHSVSDADIQVQDVSRGTVRLSARSDSRGSFALFNVPPGTYEVTATSGINQAEERVQVNSAASDATIEFRLAPKSKDVPAPQSGDTVSFSQYNVPAKARSLYEQAIQLVNKRKLDDARKKVDAALAIFPKFTEALNLRGALKANEGKIDEAISDFQQAIRYDSNYVIAYLSLGSLLNSHGRFEEAAQTLSQAEHLAPNAWQPHFELARTNLGMGKFDVAFRNIQRASELIGGPDKEVPAIHLIRGYVLVGLTEMPKAAHEIEVFLEHEPNGQLADHARVVLDQLHANTITASK